MGSTQNSGLGPKFWALGRGWGQGRGRDEDGHEHGDGHEYGDGHEHEHEHGHEHEHEDGWATTPMPTYEGLEVTRRVESSFKKFYWLGLLESRVF